MNAQKSPTQKAIWEKIYQNGQQNLYPWDHVVSFVFQHAPQQTPRKNIHILEVGCGTGNNLWFAAREGFSVTGIDASEHALKHAKARFQKDNLKGAFYAADFTRLPFPEQYFDLIIDRGSLVCVGKKAQQKTIQDIQRILKPNGKFFYNGYADSHSSNLSGELDEDHLRHHISTGNLTGVGALYFASHNDIQHFFQHGWQLISVQRKEITNMLHTDQSIHAEWLVIAQKQ